MTEIDRQWQASRDPRWMLARLPGELSERKLRLFAVACCRRILDLMPEESCRSSVETAEHFADGLVERVELSRAVARAFRISNSYESGSEVTDLVAFWAACASGYAACDAIRESQARGSPSQKSIDRFQAGDAAFHAVNAWACHVAAPPDIFTIAPEVLARTSGDHPNHRAYRAESAVQAMLLRCIFGNPFGSVAPDPSWMPTNATVLARTMYETHDFTAMPLLADLLEEAGCPAAVSDHCRGPGPHVRGCWVVDLVLGKE